MGDDTNPFLDYTGDRETEISFPDTVRHVYNPPDNLRDRLRMIWDFVRGNEVVLEEIPVVGGVQDEDD